MKDICDTETLELLGGEPRTRGRKPAPTRPKTPGERQRTARAKVQRDDVNLAQIGKAALLSILATREAGR